MAGRHISKSLHKVKALSTSPLSKAMNWQNKESEYSLLGFQYLPYDISVMMTEVKRNPINQIILLYTENDVC